MPATALASSEFAPTLAQIERLAREHLLSFRIAIGQTLLDDLFAGDATAYASRDTTKAVRFRAFIDAHGDQLQEHGLSESLLRRCITAHIVARDLPAGLLPQLALAQVQELYRLDDPAQRRLIAQATADHGWTSEEVRGAVAAVRLGQWPDADPATPGLQPPPEPAAPARTLAPGRVVTRVEKAVESLGELGGQVQEAETLSTAHRNRLKAALAALRAQADAIEAALKEG
jgi:hypothetical protein